MNRSLSCLQRCARVRLLPLWLLVSCSLDASPHTSSSQRPLDSAPHAGEVIDRGDASVEPTDAQTPDARLVDAQTLDANTTKPTEPPPPPSTSPPREPPPPPPNMSSPPPSSAGGGSAAGSSMMASTDAAAAGAAGTSMTPIAGSSAPSVDAGAASCAGGDSACVDAAMPAAGAPAPPVIVDAGSESSAPSSANQLLALVGELLDTTGAAAGQIVGVLGRLAGGAITPSLVSAVLETLEDAGLCKDGASSSGCRSICTLIDRECKSCSDDADLHPRLQRVCGEP